MTTVTYWRLKSFASRFYPHVGKPRTHPSHPDYVPSTFPKVYGEWWLPVIWKIQNWRKAASVIQSGPCSSEEIILTKLASAQQGF